MKKFEDTPFTGIYLFDPETDFKQFFQDCRTWGFNSPLLNPYLLEEGALQDEIYISANSFCLNFPVFFDQEFLQYNPDYYSITNKRVKAMSSWLHFVCPSRMDFLEYKKDQLLKLLTIFEPSSLCFDFLRFFVFWEKVYPGTPLTDIEEGCYCPQCIENFQNFSGLEIPHQNRFNWIREKARKQWGLWKCSMMSKTLKSLSQLARMHAPHMPILLKTIPWSPNDFEGAIFSVVGQDLTQLGQYVDYIVPMSFTHMLKQKTDWKARIINETRSLTEKKILSYIQVANTYRAAPLSLMEFKQDYRESRKHTPEGYILFHYETLKQSPDKLAFFLNGDK